MISQLNTDKGAHLIITGIVSNLKTMYQTKQSLVNNNFTTFFLSFYQV